MKFLEQISVKSGVTRTLKLSKGPRQSISNEVLNQILSELRFHGGGPLRLAPPRIWPGFGWPLRVAIGRAAADTPERRQQRRNGLACWQCVTSEKMRDLHHEPESFLTATDRAANPRAEPDPKNLVCDRPWQRALTGLVTLTTLTVAAGLGALYLLVSRGA